ASRRSQLARGRRRARRQPPSRAQEVCEAHRFPHPRTKEKRMSAFLNTAATMQTLSVAGMEEASRDGRREGDLEHVLLALVLSEQSAGQVLRGLGITLDAARLAVREQHQ